MAHTESTLSAEAHQDALSTATSSSGGAQDLFIERVCYRIPHLSSAYQLVRSALSRQLQVEGVEEAVARRRYRPSVELARGGLECVTQSVAARHGAL